MWSGLVLMTDSTVTHLILHGWWEAVGIMGRGECERTARRAEVKIIRENLHLSVHVPVVLFNRLALHSCSGCDWEQRTIIEGSHFALNMLTVVCKFLQSAAGVNLQVKRAAALRPITVGEVRRHDAHNISPDA